MKKNVLIGLKMVLLAFLTMVIVYYYFGFNNFSMRVPVSYNPDGMSCIAGIKELLTNGTDMLGWPFHTSVFAYRARYTMLYEIFVRACGLVTSDYSLIFDAYVFVIPCVNVFVTYVVFRLLEIKTLWSYLGALVFGFCPYVQYRMDGHNALASVEGIAIALLLVFWLFEDDNYCRFNVSWFKNKKNYVGLFFAWVIANNGMVYYPFFTCYILIVAALIKWYQDGSIKGIVPFILQIAEILFWLVVSFIPSIIGAVKGVGDTATNGAVRDATRATLYGLDIKALFLSPKGFGSEKLLEGYNYLLYYDSESKLAYIGIIGIIGLLLLLISAFIGIRSESNRNISRIGILSKMNIAAILLGVSSGLGVLVALFITPMISVYNRISPYIVCMSVLAFICFAQFISDKLSDRKVCNVIFSAFICVIFIFSLYEQQGAYKYYTTDMSQRYYEIQQDDYDFFARLENTAGEGAMVFQLPYMKSFENGTLEDIGDYDHMRCYIYTDTIKWSYGASNDSENDIWYKNTSELDLDDMCQELIAKGFSGIYLNLNGYPQEDREQVKQEFIEATKCSDVVSDGTGLRLYLSLDNYR